MILKSVEKKENNTAVFQVETDADEFEAAVNGAYLKNKGSIAIPGFRKGKAPRALVENMYGAQVFYQDAMDELAPKAFDFGLKETEIKFVGAPSISDVNVTDERTAAYTFSVELYPEVTLGEYKGLAAVRDVFEVSDEDVDKEVEAARKQNARKIEVDDRAAQMGDTVNIDFDGFIEGERFDGGKGEKFDLELGSNTFIPGFEEQVVGMTIGEEKDLNLTFPEAYGQGLGGKSVIFKVKLNGLTYSELPELDDEFAKDVSEFDTLDAYREDVRKNIAKRYTEQTDAKVRSEVLKKAADNMTVTVPEVMIMEKAEEMIRNYAANFGMTDKNVPIQQLVKMMGIDDETMSTSIHPAAEFQVKTDLLLEAVIKAENITVTDEETEAYLKKAAETFGAKPEDIKNYFGMEFVADEQKKEKATSIILDSAVITDAAPAAEEKAE